MSDLVRRLRIKAGMIEMGEMIAWGSDSALMREAADALETLRETIAQPTDTYTAVDMATAAAQGFRDGQAAVEPAGAQDGRAMQLLSELSRTPQDGEKVTRERMAAICEVGHDRAAFVAALTRPAQTEQQPWDDSMVRDFLSVALRHVEVKGTLHSQDIRDALRYMAERYAAPIAQAEQRGDA